MRRICLMPLLLQNARSSFWWCELSVEAERKSSRHSGFRQDWSEGGRTGISCHIRGALIRLERECESASEVPCGRTSLLAPYLHLNQLERHVACTRPSDRLSTPTAVLLLLRSHRHALSQECDPNARVGSAHGVMTTATARQSVRT